MDLYAYMYVLFAPAGGCEKCPTSLIGHINKVMNSNVHKLGQQFFWLSSKCVIAPISYIILVNKYFKLFVKNMKMWTSV